MVPVSVLCASGIFLFGYENMANYDASIRVDTKMNTTSAEVQLERLENRMVKTSDTIASLSAKMEALKDTKIPTQEYKEIQDQIESTKKKIDDLLARQEKFLATGGKTTSSVYKKMEYDLEELRKSLPYLEGELQDLIDTGKAFVLGQDTEEFADMGKRLKYAKNELITMNHQHKILEQKIQKASGGYKKLGDTAKKSLEKINNSTKKSNGLLSTMVQRFKGLALSLLIFNQVSKAFRVLTSSIKEGFTNLYEGNERFKSSVDNLKASALTLKNSLAAAFSPLVEIAIPYIQRFIEWLTSAINTVGQFIAALTGRKTYTKAIKQSAAASEKATEATENEAEATEDETKAMNKQLSSLDKLNNLTSEKADKKDRNSDKGIESGDVGVGTMFEEVPIDNKILDFLQKLKDFLQPVIDYAQKLKDIFMEGFWDGLGDWEYRWDSIKNNLASIKDSLINIFTDPEVVGAADGWAQSFSYMLGSLAGSVASIGLTIATNLIGGVERYLKDNKERIKDYLVSMFDIGTEINNIVAELSQSVAFIFEAFASDNGIQLTANILGIILNTLMGISEIVFKLARDILKIFAKPIIDNAEKFKIALEGILKFLASITGTIKQGIDDTFDHLNKIYDEHLKPFFDSVAQGVSDLTGQFLEFWNNDVQPILDEWAEKFDALWKEHIQPALDKIGDAIGRVADFLKDLWEKGLKPIISWVIDNILPVLLPIIDELFTASLEFIGWLFDVIGGLMDVFIEFVNLISSLLEGDLKGALQSIGNIFSTVWNGIVNTVGAAVNKIAEWISKLLGLFSQASTAARSMTSGALGSAMGGALRNSRTTAYSMSPSVNAAMAGLSEIEFPGYATGQVIPRTMRQHLAILGDNNRETEVVSPLSTIEQAVRNAIGGAQPQEINLNLTVECEGHQLLQIMQKLDGEYFKQTGKHAFA